MPVTTLFTPTGESRSTHICHPAEGVTLIVFRRAAPRGWMWRGQSGAFRTGGRYAEGRAATRAAAEAAALEWFAAA